MLQKNDLIYLFTNGYTDQNSSERKAFGRQGLINLIQQNAGITLDEQKRELEKVLDKHQGFELQRDDITVVYIKPK